MAKARKAKKPPRESDGESVVAPSVRVFNDWDPGKIKAAQYSAESGVLTNVVLVCEWLLTDDRVVGALDSRCDALFGLKPTFEASGDKRRSKRAVKALEAGEDFWKAYPESTLRTLLKWGLLLGAAPARHEWKRIAKHGNRVLPMPEFFHPQTLRYDMDKRLWSIHDRKNKQEFFEPGDSTWILHTPFGTSRPWAYGVWRSIALWVLVKHFAQLDRARHSEKASTLVATSDESTAAQRRELAEDLKNSGTDRVVALAAGFDLKLVEVSANTQQIYDSQIEGADKAIAILIRGGNLSSDVKDGSRAAAEVQERTGDRAKLRFDAQALSSTLNEQSLSWWALFNFGDENLAPWPEWPVEPEEDKKSAADTIKVLGEGLSILDKLGFELDDKKLIERFDLDFVLRRKTPEERAKLLQQMQQQMQPTDPNAPPGQQQDPQPGDDKDGGEGDDKGKAKGDEGAAAEGDKPAQKRGGLIQALASGDSLADNPGFAGGQLYVDAVAENASEAAAELLEPTLEDIAREIEAATSYEDLRRRLRALYPKLGLEDLGELCYRAMLLGELAGRRAVTQDG